MLKEIGGILNYRPLLPVGLYPGRYDVLNPAQLLRPETPLIRPGGRQYTLSDSLQRGY